MKNNPLKQLKTVNTAPLETLNAYRDGVAIPLEDARILWQR
jgi:hypothetical protein